VNFKIWFQEWEGAKFTGDSNELVNTPDYWPLSKYQGKGKSFGAPSFLGKVEKMYGRKPQMVIKYMKKKS
jgi:hypothetical protein